jgi:hypothetical protein
MDVGELKTEQRISYLASSCRTKTSRRELIDIAKKFSQNLEGGDGDNGMKYVYIYKNLLRDMKIYFLQQYQEFINNVNPQSSHLLKNDKSSLFHAHILLFV